VRPGLTKKSALNNSFLVPPASRSHVGGHVEVEKSSENEDAKKPQLPQDHPEGLCHLGDVT
jgi:hypothetical protein